MGKREGVDVAAEYWQFSQDNGWRPGMDALSILLDLLKKESRVQEHFLGLLHILIGRRLTTAAGDVVSTGLSWRDLSVRLKKVRWDPEAVRRLGIEPSELPPRDRQRYWYAAISRAQVDSAAAMAEAEKLGALLQDLGYVLTPQRKPG